MIVMCLVVVDVVIMIIYTSLEVSGGGASLVINGEMEVTVSGVCKLCQLSTYSTLLMCMQTYNIRESVDSLCRDGADACIMYYIL